MNPADIPTIACRLDPGGRTLRFWCTHCRGPHMHGMQGIDDGSNTHRSSHCWRPGSPYTNGYFLTVSALHARTTMADRGRHGR